MKSRYALPFLLFLLSCSGTMPLSAQPAPLPPAPKPPKPAPKVLPVAKVQMPLLVQPGQLFAITTRGSVGTGRTAIFRPELPIDASVLEFSDKRTKDDAFMVTLPKGASGNYVFVFVVTQAGVAEPAVEAVPFVVGKAPDEPVDPIVPPKPVDPVTPPPAGKYGLAPLAFQWGSAVASANRVAEAKLLANIYRTKAGELAATSKDAQTAIIEARAEAKAAMGGSDEAWRVGFWVKAGAKLAELKITSKVDCAQAFDELKNGLEAVR